MNFFLILKRFMFYELLNRNKKKKNGGKIIIRKNKMKRKTYLEKLRTKLYEKEIKGKQNYRKIGESMPVCEHTPMHAPPSSDSARNRSSSTDHLGCANGARIRRKYGLKRCNCFGECERFTFVILHM